MFEPYANHTLVDSPDYRSELEELRDGDGNQMLCIHLDVKTFAPSVLKRIVSDFGALRTIVDAPIFAIEPNPDDEKWERFVSHCGFEFLSRAECTDGKSRRYFVSNKKKNNAQLYDKLPDAELQPERAAVVGAAALPPAGIRAGSD